MNFMCFNWQMLLLFSRIVHMKEKFKCSFCDHQDAQKWRMKQHIQVNHLGEKLFPCHICDYSADGKRRLDSHFKNSHPKEWSLTQNNQILTWTIFPLKWSIECHIEVTFNGKFAKQKDKIQIGEVLMFSSISSWQSNVVHDMAHLTVSSRQKNYLCKFRYGWTVVKWPRLLGMFRRI